MDVLRRMRDEMTPPEFAAIAEALGWPEGMVPTAWLDERGPMSVPESLWLRASVYDD